MRNFSITQLVNNSQKEGLAGKDLLNDEKIKKAYLGMQEWSRETLDSRAQEGHPQRGARTISGFIIKLTATTFFMQT